MDFFFSKLQALKKWPKITIVTPSFNQGLFVEDTIKSIINQKYPNLEFIIVDGGSTDETLNVIRRYESSTSYWVSEPDEGQTHAIQKGLSIATGDIFNWINSDDLLAPNALWHIGKIHAENPDAIIAGPVENFQGLRTQIIANKNLSLKNFMLNSKDFSFHQPGVWIPLKKWDIGQALDRSYHYVFDHKMMIELLYQGASIEYIPQLLAHFRLHESSKSVAQSVRFHEEFFRLFDEYLKDSRFIEYHPMIEETIANHHQKWDWKDRLEVIQTRAGSRWGKALQIAQLILTKPDEHLNRFSLGAMKKCLTLK